MLFPSPPSSQVARAILEAKNVPYLVAAPLLLQDIPSWQRDGVQGLQSVVLYSLPELDGAIDAVPLGGLVGNGIHLVRGVPTVTWQYWFCQNRSGSQLSEAYPPPYADLLGEQAGQVTWT